MKYQEYLLEKTQLDGKHGFKPVFVPDFLFDFQKALIEWTVERGRAAVFADCGLGKTPMELVWAENIVRHTNKPVLILTPLAVSFQEQREGEKFGIECQISRDGKFDKKIIITNYERLHYFNWQDFSGCACDESSILKNYDGKTKDAVTEFMRKLAYRSLWTATAAPNDYIELGTSSEALGELGYVDMLKMFFKSTQNTFAQGGSGVWGGRRFAGHENLFGGKFRFRGHAERDFWRWVCSWARALRKPSDMGFDDSKFVLPPLKINDHIVQARTKNTEFLFDLPAISLEEQRDERRRTLTERCELAANLIQKHEGASVAWCYLNAEGDLLERLIPGCVQVAGKDSDEKKEEAFLAFQKGEVKKLVTKSDIGGFGQNWQHCHHQTYFPSHSFEQYYQSVRRSWRFGQKHAVTVDIITSEGESRVMENLQRKAEAAEQMFGRLVELMNNELNIEHKNLFTKKETIPSWLS